MKIKHLDGLYNRSVFRIMTMILFFLFLGVGNTFSNVNASNAPDEQLQQGKKIKGVVRDETGVPMLLKKVPVTVLLLTLTVLSLLKLSRDRHSSSHILVISVRKFR